MSSDGIKRQDKLCAVHNKCTWYVKTHKVKGQRNGYRANNNTNEKKTIVAMLI
jgi:hypothetical protein